MQITKRDLTRYGCQVTDGNHCGALGAIENIMQISASGCGQTLIIVNNSDVINYQVLIRSLDQAWLGVKSLFENVLNLRHRLFPKHFTTATYYSESD